MPSERQLIEKIRKLAAVEEPSITVPLGDDAAVLRCPEGRQLVVAKDVLVENRHFKLPWTIPEFLAQKSLAVNLSDLAAMGATPCACLLGLTLPPVLSGEFFDRFLRAFCEAARNWHCPLIGGDLSGGDFLHASVTVLGSVGENPWGRNGGLAGDSLVLVGNVGLASRGLRDLERLEELPGSIGTRQQLRRFSRQQGLRSLFIEAQLLPEPQLQAAAFLSDQVKVHAAIDISDGLAGDVEALAQASGLRAILDWSRLELLQKCGSVRIEIEDLLNGGEDYALVLALAPAELEKVLKDYPNALMKPRRIGELCEGVPGLAVRRNHSAEPLAIRRFDHFL